MLLGRSHRSYKCYTSMDRALAFLLDGHLYLGNGDRWNDVRDRRFMKGKGAYSMCFSYSTDESMAMWMLYGADRGRNGAVIDFLPSVIKTALEVSSLEVGKFDSSNQFKCITPITKTNNDFKIFLTDVVYYKNDAGVKRYFAPS